MTDQEKMEIYHRLVEEKMASGESFFDFEGNNCHDVAGWNEDVPECSGWDGDSRRCECGNRRVSWTLSDDCTYVYGEAY